MHPVIKNIIKKNSIYAVLGVVLQVGAILCLVKAIFGTVKEIQSSVKKALDEYSAK